MKLLIGRQAGRATRFALCLVLALAAPVAAQTKLLRYPDIHGDRVVFTYAGDLWTAPATGGTAVRLTAHPGLELFAKYSPDGKWIAFTGQYDGDEQVYVIPATGGVPTQLTFYPAQGPLPVRWGYDNQVYGWTPDGSAIVFRSLRDGWDPGQDRLYTVPRTGGLPVALPMPTSGAGDLSPDGRRIVYSPLFRDFRAWKRYQGGWAEDLWVFDLATHDAKNITNNVRTDRDPMWIGDRIYFDSDRDNTLNLYTVKPDGTDLVQLTHQTTWDVEWPSADETGDIVYQLAGELHVLDTKTRADRRLDITVPDDGLAARPVHKSVADDIEDVALSPDGHRALFTARGDIFTVPAEHGPTRNLTHSSSAHDKGARWSPDGRQIAFISDMSGEDEVYVVNQDGSGVPERLTTNGDQMRFAPSWSPDGKRLAFTDKSGQLWMLEVATKTLTRVARDPTGNLSDQTWSPDSRWLTFSLSHESGFRSIYIWNVADGTTHEVTDEMYNSVEPVFGHDGQYLFFLSDREFAPQVSSFEWDYATDRTTGIFALALRKDVAAPFPPESDEAKIETAPPAGGAAPATATAGGPKAGTVADIGIDFDGLAGRIARVPVPADNYSNLTAFEGHLIYVKGTPYVYGRAPETPPDVMIFGLADRKASTLVAGTGVYTPSADGKKLLVRAQGQWKLVDAKPQGGSSAQAISTAGLQADIVPKAEWTEIFHEVWRRFRDYFYVPTMNGYDWTAIRNRYEPLLQYVGHRTDLDYIMSEMIGELSNSHTYISGGDYDIPKRADVALPGARFELDAASGRYRIASLFAGDNSEAEYRSPLTEIGVDAHVGDYVLAIDGVDLKAPENPYELLRYKSAHPVTLTLNSRPATDGARRVTYQPITSETPLVYKAWVDRNRQEVDTLTSGRVGYLHIPDMGAEGLSEFIKWFYPQVRKDGLVIDVRGNGGGNVSSMLIERLSRVLLASGYSRNDDFPSTYPRGPVFYGSLVALLNQTSGSDGDIFPAMFKQAGLGPLIGMRSWGGVTGITGHGPLIDGGDVEVPEFGFTSTDGKWIIEGHGVDPDIPVENDPKSVIAGHDPQLERGVQEILKLIQAHPKHLPARPAPPNRAPGGGGGGGR
jgi:tricorn protease